ncbi:MAG: AzlC family ABC transporter permease [Deltaproteobacteria bacterium]|jgi:4-azaleucine resistance transporter AzlC|nr:AzlC family ABC transporter permease [Deltaproteobacteria bacterium]
MQRDFMNGARRAIPIVLGYIPIAFAFGVLSSQAGLSPLESTLMSIIVFAGSAQFIAVQLILGGAAPLSVVTAVLLINSRYMLMSAALLPYLRHWSKKLQAVFCFGMADEPFILNIGRFAGAGVNRDEALGVNLAAYLAWVIPSALGAVSGQVIGDMRPYGLDFALPGVLIALLISYCKKSRELATVVLAACISVVLVLCGVGQWNILLATFAAATLGLLLPFKNGQAQRNQGGVA